MSLLFHIAIKYIIRMKFKSFMSIISLAIVTSVIIITSNTISYIYESDINARKLDAGKYYFSTEFNDYKRVSDAIDLISFPSEDYYALEYLYGSAALSPDTKVVIYGMEQNAFSMESIKLIQGRLPEGENEICMEEHILSDFNGLELYDEFEIDIRLSNNEVICKTFVLTGIISRMQNRSRYFGEYGILYTTSTTVANSYDLNLTSVKLLGLIADIEKEDFKGKLPGLFIPNYINLFNEVYDKTGVEIIPNYVYYSIIENMGTNLLKYVMAAIIIISIIIIYGIFNINLESRKKHYQLLRSIGITRTQLLGLLFIESLILSILGWITGFIAGYGICEYIMKGIISSWKEIEYIEGFYTPSVALSFFICIFISITSLLIPALRISNYHPYHVNDEKKKRYSILRSISRNRDDPSLYLAICNISILNAKNSIIIFSLVFSMLVSMFTVFTYSEYDGLKDRLYYKCDFEISTEYSELNMFHEAFTNEDIIKIKEVKGIIGVYGVYQYQTQVKLDFNKIFTNNKNETNKIYIDDFDYENTKRDGLFYTWVNLYACDEYFFSEALENEIIDAEEFILLMNENTCIAVPYIYDNILTASMDYDQIYVPLSSEIMYENMDSYRSTKIVKNIKTDLLKSPVGNFNIYISLEQFFGNDEVKLNNLLIFTDKEVDKFYIKHELYKISLPYRTAKLTDYEDEINRESIYALNLLYALIVLSIVIYIVMLLNVFNTAMSSMRGRLKNLVLFRTIGMEYVQIKKMFFYEGLFFGILSSVIGLITGVVATIMIAWDLVEETSLKEVLVGSPWPTYVVLFVINILFCIVIIQLCLRINIDNIESKGENQGGFSQ